VVQPFYFPPSLHTCILDKKNAYSRVKREEEEERHIKGTGPMGMAILLARFHSTAWASSLQPPFTSLSSCRCTSYTCLSPSQLSTLPPSDLGSFYRTPHYTAAPRPYPHYSHTLSLSTFAKHLFCTPHSAADTLFCLPPLRLAYSGHRYGGCRTLYHQILYHSAVRCAADTAFWRFLGAVDSSLEPL